MAKTLMQQIATDCKCGHPKGNHKGDEGYCETFGLGSVRQLESCACAAFDEAPPWGSDSVLR